MKNYYIIEDWETRGIFVEKCTDYAPGAVWSPCFKRIFILGVAAFETYEAALAGVKREAKQKIAGITMRREAAQQKIRECDENLKKVSAFLQGLSETEQCWNADCPEIAYLKQRNRDLERQVSQLTDWEEGP